MREMVQKQAALFTMKEWLVKAHRMLHWAGDGDLCWRDFHSAPLMT